MTFRPSTTRLVIALLIAGAHESRSQINPVSVTLTATTSPSAGEPGVTNISVTGSGFPAGTIPASNVTITLKPASGGANVTTSATAIAPVIGSTRRMSFTIPNSVSVSAPTIYAVSLAGTSSSNVGFASSNTALLTVDPGASVTTVMPSTGQAGQTLTVAVTGTYSHFLQNVTTASFGAGITVNSTVISSATQANVNITIGTTAASGPRIVTLTTGAEVAALASGFTVLSS